MLQRLAGIACVVRLGMVLALLALGGCIWREASNPSVHVTLREARLDLVRMRQCPRPLHRPVVILNGYHTLPVLAAIPREELMRATSGRPEDFMSVSYVLGPTIEGAAIDAVRAVEGRWPSADADETIEVDVVGISMGGLVARYAASSMFLPDMARAGRGGVKRLRIARLFTLATPHNGSRVARFVRLDPAAWDMAPGSAFLARLDADRARAMAEEGSAGRKPVDRADAGGSGAASGYELICYAHAYDFIVGSARSSPPGTSAIRTGGTWFFSHFSVVGDPVILADIARRLRDEEPICGGGS